LFWQERYYFPAPGFLSGSLQMPVYKKEKSSISFWGFPAIYNNQ
jgi:hypothetical protein